eukprot:scpid44910/ scgid18785/ GTP-binding protein 2; GTP-binding-like protein 2
MASSDLTVLMVSDTTEAGHGNTTTGCNYEESPSCVPPEPQEGNIEYKLKLVSPSPLRIVHLVTQLKWRLREGQGEAIYEIGVEDSGALAGLVNEDMNSSLNTLQNMAQQLGAITTVLRRCPVECREPDAEPRFVAEVLVRTMPDDHQVLPLRIAVLGGEAAGKSTLLGVLTRGILDNGRGSARLNLLQHPHELASGHTSSICHEILGFDKGGKVVNYGAGTGEEFVEQSAKLLSFVDLAGHRKYQHTTMRGLSCWHPEFVMLVVSASKGVEGMTREHLGWATALHVPIFVVITKVDGCPKSALRRVVQQLTRLMATPGSNRSMLLVETEADSILAAKNLSLGSVVPVFSVSSVAGTHLDLLKHFLNLIPARLSAEEQLKLEEDCTEFQVEDTYQVAGVGTVVGGILRKGVIRLGDELTLGPSQEGSFGRSLVMGLRRNRLPCRMIRAGQVATVALPSVQRTDVRRGTVLLGFGAKLRSVCWEFEANLYPLSNPAAVHAQRHVNVLMGAIRQGAVVLNIDGGAMSFGACTTIRFRFLRSPEYVTEGRRLIIQCGGCKGIGEVTSITPIPLEMAQVKKAGGRRVRLATT